MPITIKKLHRLFCAEIGGVTQRTTVNGGVMTTAQPERYELAAE